MSTFRLLLASLIACFTCSIVFAQQADTYTDTYQVPRTQYGQPDLQGTWAAFFTTPLERPPGVDLILDDAQAHDLANVIYASTPDNIDPDIDSFGPPTLARVKGENRSSVIVYPEDGQMPFNEAGLELSLWNLMREEALFDHPEQRPKVERCLESWAFPPMRVIPFYLPNTFVQTRDQIAIISEDSVPLRTIHMNGYVRPDAIRTWQGHSVGHWEGDTLVVEITHFRDDDPARANLGRPVLLSGDARVVERFTRVSDTELYYEYTVEDEKYYTEPWRGEFSFNLSNQISYEYSCHEGNYSMVGALRGARVQELRASGAFDSTN